MRTPIVKVMIGHRRVGKSFILFQLIELIRNDDKNANIIYINKEDIEFVEIVSYRELYDYISKRLVADRKNYIFIDEIQEIADFKVTIRSLALDDNNDIYIAGSNSEMFSSDLANELGGRYDIVGKKLFERGEKFFFENMGIRNTIAGYKPQDRAKRLENIVCNHLLFCGYDVKVGALSTEEIDFVCTRGGETLYVQMAIELSSPETISREFGNMLKIRDNYPKIVVLGERSFENSYEGVEHIYIRDFLSSTLTPKIL